MKKWCCCEYLDWVEEIGCTNEKSSKVFTI